jgi:hypothetical protein
MNSTFLLPDGHAAGTATDRLAGLTASLRRAGLAVWRALEESGHARAMRELRNLHDRWEVSDPGRAKQMSDAGAFLIAQDAQRRR